MIKWGNKKHYLSTEHIDLFNLIKQEEVIEQAIIRDSSLESLVRDGRYGLRRMLWEACLGTVVSSIEGDLENVLGIRTRMVTVYKKESSIGEVLNIINDAISQLKITKVETNLLLFIEALFLLRGYVAERNRFLMSSSASAITSQWRQVAENINEILGAMDTIKKLPLKISDIINTDDLFEPSRYWMDWNRHNEKNLY